ncbi:hypothetical protein LTR82_006074 [Friedmanniomyces endolithicus]|uniref:Uncharacterized protein n=1 Tax=Friedmanniomyces endolithicus TaxID=329885 RepID=A0AAN6JAW9_9PEZI|nr:hypothetical protein LTR82_006074 [Friedmanniomyces endolithicus]
MLDNSIVTASVAVASVVSALPSELSKRANIDTTVLQVALTLEHLENVFYKQALKNFSLTRDAGYSADYYNDLNYIAHDEEQHVLLLEGALTAACVTPVQACTYSFPYYDVLVYSDASGPSQRDSRFAGEALSLCLRSLRVSG